MLQFFMRLCSLVKESIVLDNQLVIDRDLGLGLGLGRDRLFGGISVSAEIVNFSAENRDKLNSKKNVNFSKFQDIFKQKFSL